MANGCIQSCQDYWSNPVNLVAWAANSGLLGVNSSNSSMLLARFGLDPNKYVSIGGFYHYNGNIDLSNKSLKTLYDFSLLNIKYVHGTFTISYNGLTSLRGCPTSIDGGFDCSYNYLHDLEYTPDTVGGNYNCSHNCILSLIEFPSEIGGGFDVSYNQLDGLFGLLSTGVSGYINVSHNCLTTLDNTPGTWMTSGIGGFFNCSYNLPLTTLEDGPTKVLGEYIANNCSLTEIGLSLELSKGLDISYNNIVGAIPANIPALINGDLNISHNSGLDALTNCPTVKGSLNCSYCGLTALTSATLPEKSFDCSYNRITGIPATIFADAVINGNFNVSNNAITALTNGPLTINGDFNCSNNSLAGLSGGPTTVTGTYNASYNSLTDLDDLATTIGKDILVNNNVITSLVKAGATTTSTEAATATRILPMTIYGDLDVSNNQLISLAPTLNNTTTTGDLATGKTQLVINGSLRCNNNAITSLQYTLGSAISAIKTLGGSLEINNNQLTVLTGIPTRISKDLKVANNILTALTNCPTTITGSFDCSNNRLTALTGIATSIKGSINVSHNSISSLAPIVMSTINGDLNCSYNNMTDLSSITLLGKCKFVKIYGNFDCGHNTISSTIIMTTGTNGIVQGKVLNVR